jgi:4-hydroxybenzoyl-CoA thioesterase
MPRVCTRRMLINDIDAAGIAYTGRLVTIALEALETGLADVGLDFAAMLREKRFGAPLVHIEADFKRPFRHGEHVDIDLWCIGISERSYTCRIDLLPAGGTLVAASLSFTAAVIEMATFTSVPVPDYFRAALERLSPPRS